MSAQDQLCDTCAGIDLYSLFTGPRYYYDGCPDRPEDFDIHLSTLAEILIHDRCPLCRLLKHDAWGLENQLPWEASGGSIDLAKISVAVRPIRADYDEDLKCINAAVRDKVATMLCLYFSAKGLSAEEETLFEPMGKGHGIRLLSPESIDPARPLLNGYQATTTRHNLDLCRDWMTTCVESHTSESKENVCRRVDLSQSMTVNAIRVLDVATKRIVHRNPLHIDYAALSYVWTTVNDLAPSKDPARQSHIEVDDEFSHSPAVTSDLPMLVQDAIIVCNHLSIPYLWVDRYCIDQTNPTDLAAEIDVMGHRYHYAKITLIAGREIAENNQFDVRLLPDSSRDGDMSNLQRIETIQGRQYITSLPTIVDQLGSTRWIERAWTMQEGQLANRCAFFGLYDISFLCGLGHWRESSHSGQFGHSADLPDLDTRCEGFDLLSWQQWLKQPHWDFNDYNSLLGSYTPRHMTFENDILRAIVGCLNLISEAKKVPFVHGLPLRDFHYALLWKGEDHDNRRVGFPSWSWTGWSQCLLLHPVYPMYTSGDSEHCATGKHRAPFDIHAPQLQTRELQGDYISIEERPHRSNRCLQRFADVDFADHETHSLLKIASETAHFGIDIIRNTETSNKRLAENDVLDILPDFDSTRGRIDWDTDASYRIPVERLRLHDDYNHSYLTHYPSSYDHWSPLQINLPRKLRGDTLAWLLQDGIQLVKIVEIELIEGEESLAPFTLVLCLGLDTRDVRTKRLGMFCMSKERWEAARPTASSVILG